MMIPYIFTIVTTVDSRCTHAALWHGRNVVLYDGVESVYLDGKMPKYRGLSYMFTHLSENKEYISLEAMH